MKLVLMKYLNSRGLPCYRRITGEETLENDKDCLEMMELEAEEMFFAGEMEEKLWIKCLDKNQYRQLMDEEARARIATLDKIIKTWEETN